MVIIPRLKYLIKVFIKKNREIPTEVPYLNKKKYLDIVKINFTSISMNDIIMNKYKRKLCMIIYLAMD